MKIKSIISALLCTVMLVGCKPSDNKVLSIAETELASSLKDPDSAKFKDTVYYPDEKNGPNESNGYVCGMVNAKNSYGAYTGFQPFYIHVAVETRYLIPQLGVLHGASNAKIFPDPGEDKLDERLKILKEYLSKCPGKK